MPQTTEACDPNVHLEELKVLYAEIPRNLSATGSLFAPLFSKSSQEFASFFEGESKPNPNYPSEDYQAFLRRILNGKKTLIESILGLRS